ncbi:MAG: AAA family ATPase [Bacteroidaceae bacterium]|nr:AAA family ATPase [Bacteroidaceae bacterium]
MTATQPIKQLPLGIADFERIVRENYYYVDKTEYIPALERTSSYLFLVRPRRFGKSLLLSMLRPYRTPPCRGAVPWTPACAFRGGGEGKSEE